MTLRILTFSQIKHLFEVYTASRYRLMTVLLLTSLWPLSITRQNINTSINLLLYKITLIIQYAV